MAQVIAGVACTIRRNLTAVRSLAVWSTEYIVSIAADALPSDVSRILNPCFDRKVRAWPIYKLPAHVLCNKGGQLGNKSRRQRNCA